MAKEQVRAAIASVTGKRFAPWGTRTVTTPVETFTNTPPAAR